MSSELTRPGDDLHITRAWSKGSWQKYVFPGFWLFYLAQTVDGVRDHSHGVAEVIGIVIVPVFAAGYLAALPMTYRERPARKFVPIFVTLVGLTAVETQFAHEDALIFCVYLGVLTVAARAWWTALTVAGLAGVTGFLPLYVPGWGHRFGWSGASSVLLVSFAMFGFFTIIRANNALALARSEVARLAAENERSRIARDLHDLLGHSLTTITVKAGLARRLAESGDPARALIEISEVEKLSRRTLGDVRAAVAGHNDVTLVGELATAREVLRAAGVLSELPGSVDVVEPSLSELFGWVLRESVTNVVRHSRADHCRVTLGPTWIEIADDGVGCSGMSAETGPSHAGTGHGLSGLRSRVEAAGGVVTFPPIGRGFVVRAEAAVMPERATAPDCAATPLVGQP